MSLWPSAFKDCEMAEGYTGVLCFQKIVLEMSFFKKILLKLGLSIILRKGIKKRIAMSTVKESLFDMEVEERVMCHLCGLCHKILVF